MAESLSIQNRDRMLSTGKVAKLLSVTPDTVLKWIKNGQLPAIRTAGGHYRIARRDLDGLVPNEPGPRQSSSSPGGFVYCWEYYATGDTANAGCLECLAYRTRASRCYEMSDLPPDVGYAGAYCETSCEECAYYREVVLRPLRVLIVTRSPDLRRRIEGAVSGSRLEVEFAGSEYECSAACASSRPGYVVIDGALPKQTRASLCSHLAADPRIPGVQIILAVSADDLSVRETVAGIDRLLPRTFSLAELDDHIASLEVTPTMTA